MTDQLFFEVWATYRDHSGKHRTFPAFSGTDGRDVPRWYHVKLVLESLGNTEVHAQVWWSDGLVTDVD